MRPIHFAAFCVLVASACTRSPPPAAPADVPTSPVPEADDEPTWATMPSVELGGTECVENAIRPSLCEWVWSADALVLAKIVATRSSWAPIRARVAGETREFAAEQCVFVVPAVELDLEGVEVIGGPATLPAQVTVSIGAIDTDGWDPALDRYLPDTETAPSSDLVFQDEGVAFESSAQVLLPLIIGEAGITVVDGGLLPAVIDGGVHVPDPQELCIPGQFEGEGQPVEDFAAAARECSDSDAAVARRESTRLVLKPDDPTETVAFAAQCEPRFDDGAAAGEGEGEGE